MPQQIQELIDKIKAEGVQEAQTRAAAIEAEAQQKAATIIKEAKATAEKIVADAQHEAQKAKEAGTMALQQAGRTTLLSVRKDIESILKKIIVHSVKDGLTAEVMGKVLEACVAQALSKGNTDIQVVVSPELLTQLKEGFVAKLQHQLKVGITLKSSNDVGKGMAVSFDNGKSQFDFSDAALADYLGAYLNTELAMIIKK